MLRTCFSTASSVTTSASATPPVRSASRHKHVPLARRELIAGIRPGRPRAGSRQRRDRALSLRERHAAMRPRTARGRQLGLEQVADALSAAAEELESEPLATCCRSTRHSGWGSARGRDRRRRTVIGPIRRHADVGDDDVGAMTGDLQERGRRAVPRRRRPRSRPRSPGRRVPRGWSESRPRRLRRAQDLRAQRRAAAGRALHADSAVSASRRSDDPRRPLPAPALAPPSPSSRTSTTSRPSSQRVARNARRALSAWRCSRAPRRRRSTPRPRRALVAMASSSWRATGTGDRDASSSSAAASPRSASTGGRIPAASARSSSSAAVRPASTSSSSVVWRLASPAALRRSSPETQEHRRETLLRPVVETHARSATFRVAGGDESCP